MMHLASRLQVRANAAVLPFLALPKPLSFIGPDASLTLARTIAGSGVRKIMLVTDAVLVKLGLLAQILDVLDRADVGIEVFDQVLPDPDFDTVLAGVERLRQSAAQAVLTVGGGSPIDCAKAILMSHANDCHPAKLAGLWLYARPRAPAVCLSTQYRPPRARVLKSPSAPWFPTRLASPSARWWTRKWCRR
jgi:alcohol dehydrogenase